MARLLASHYSGIERSVVGVTLFVDRIFDVFAPYGIGGDWTVCQLSFFKEFVASNPQVLSVGKILASSALMSPSWLYYYASCLSHG